MDYFKRNRYYKSRVQGHIVLCSNPQPGKPYFSGIIVDAGNSQILKQGQFAENFPKSTFYAIKHKNI